MVSDWIKPCGRTVIVMWFVWLPSWVVAVIVVVPGDIAVTRPWASMVAALLLLEDQVMLVFVAFGGVIVAVSWVVSFAANVRFGWSIVMLVTGVVWVWGPKIRIGELYVVTKVPFPTFPWLLRPQAH